MKHIIKLFSFFLFIQIIIPLQIFAQLAKRPNSVVQNNSFKQLELPQKLANPSSIIYQDDMNGDNSIAGLEARGWTVIDWDGGGESPAWFQGETAEFFSHEGPGNGYVASKENGQNNGIIYHSLISPQITVSAGDTLSFWIRSGSASFKDSLAILLSDDGTIESLYLDSYFEVPKSGWSRYGGTFENDGTIRFAFEYFIFNASINGWYIGIDLAEILSSNIIITTAPSATAGSATNIATTTATLNGTINPNGATTTYQFHFGTSTDYGNIVSLGDQLSGTTSIPVQIDVSGLTPNTDYHYRIRAENSGGITFSNDASFKTNSEGNSPPLATTNPATNIETTTATLNGTINPNGLNTTYIFEYGTSTSYGNSVTGSSGFTGSTNVNVSSNISGLTSNTSYHYRIVATNSAGTTNGNDVSFRSKSTTGSDIDLVLSILSPSTHFWDIGSSIDVDLTIKNNGTSTAGSQTTQLYLSTDNESDINDVPIGNPISFPSIQPNDTVSLRETFTVPTINSSVYYLMATIDVNNSVEETDEKNAYYNTYQIVLGYPVSLQVNSTFSFNDPSLSSSFRMVGLPGDGNLPITQLLSGNQEEDWVSYFDNGSSSDYLVSYNNTDQFNFGAGKGFWILSKDAMVVNQSSSAVELEFQLDKGGPGNTYVIVSPITLHNEWNIISNPYEIDVSWAEIQGINGITESLHSFEGSYSTSSVLQPYKGYYFMNSTNLNSLFIPYSRNQNLPKRNILLDEISENISISLKGNEEIKSTIFISFDDKSVSGYDSLDRFIPPGDFEEERIYIFNSDLNTEYKYLKKDYRNPEENQIYHIEVKYPLNKNYNLLFNELNDDVKNAYLVGPNVNFVNLKTKNTLRLKSTQKINKFSLLIGSDEFINAQRQELLPKNYILSQNYPNPFNPSTTINYSLPEETKVTIKIYDVLGKEIITLVNEEKSHGNYELEFQANKLSSGIYFYKIVTPNFVETKKMILLK